jgi:MFS family permease
MQTDIKSNRIAATLGRLGRSFSDSFTSLRNRNFRLYFIGQLISNTGSWLTNVALILLVLHITGSGVAVGVMTAFESVPLLLLSAWGGAITDRVDKRRFIILTQSLMMCDSAVLSVITFLPHPSLASLYALGLLSGVLAAFDVPLRRAFVREMVPPEDVSNAVVLYSIIFNMARIFGPALAGLLVVTLGYGWCFAIDAATFLAVLYCLYIMRPAELHRTAPAPRVKGEVRAGLRYVASMPSLWISFGMLTAVFLLAYNFNTTLPLFTTRSLHSNESVYTLLYSTFSIGAVISGLVVARRHMVHLRHIIFGSFAMGVTMLILALTPSVALAVPAVFLVGASAIVFMTASTAIVQIEGRPDMCGRVLALQTVVMNGTAVIGGPALGWMADTFGGRVPILAGAGVCLASAAFGYYADRRFNKAPASDAATPSCTLPS